MTFNDFKIKWTPIIDNYLASHLKLEVNNAKLSEIMAYSVMAGGKRLRPLLFLATYSALNKEISEKEVRIACGIELIHTYSLIHDDLPAMDNDDYRRGELTSHKRWGEAEAILAGDALLPMGIQWIVEGSNEPKLVKIITVAIGANGMVGGQYLDIDSTNNKSVANDANFIDKMEWQKTGCLIQASVEMATIHGKASSQSGKQLVAFAKDFGRAYQIYDDLVDIVETTQEAGKATHKDQASGKNNTLTLLGAKKSRQELQELIRRAKSNLANFDDSVLVGFLDLYQKVL